MRIDWRLRYRNRKTIRGWTIALFAFAFAFAYGAVAAELPVRVLDSAARPVPDAVVVAVPASGSAAAATNLARTAEMDQVGKQFNPSVLVVEAGTDVNFPNHDQIYHHVYSFSPTKHFELPLYGTSQKNVVRFDQPGIAVIGCNIHDWMIGYIYVAESPYFAKTDSAGGAILTGLPEGHYTIRIWHPRMKGPEHGSDRPVDVGTATSEQTWQISLSEPLPQRRAPLPGSHGY